ncbi:MAG: hypothetical protein F4Y28_00535 [Acidimicrobiia bacterium]|nr:hypothetical protein [Acidimicrobiia bacterium]MYG59569.1 hypothetical protein [Acidimicrobiia bacterium]MYJ31653.1 hypothetical protein [Acidimicrobiia bacterium]
MNRTLDQRQEAKLLGSRLAYEAGVHWLDANVKALESLRTRALALMSVMLIAATFVANVAPTPTKGEGLSSWAWAGIALFGLGLAVTIAMGVYVVWTASFTAELGPLKIIDRHVDPYPTWPSSNIYKEIAKDLDGYAKESRRLLRNRASCYKWSLLGVPIGVVGVALLWVDVKI